MSSAANARRPTIKPRSTLNFLLSSSLWRNTHARPRGMLGQDDRAVQLIKICCYRFQIPLPACLSSPIPHTLQTHTYNANILPIGAIKKSCSRLQGFRRRLYFVSCGKVTRKSLTHSYRLTWEQLGGFCFFFTRGLYGEKGCQKWSLLLCMHTHAYMLMNTCRKPRSHLFSFCSHQSGRR